MDRKLITTLFISMALILASGLLYPKFAKRTENFIAEWHVINTNIAGKQGDANIMIVGDQVVMIDAGQIRTPHRAVLRYLKEFEITKIDHLFISHPSKLYFGGLVSIIDQGTEIENIYYHLPDQETAVVKKRRPRLLKYLGFAKDNGSKLIPIDNGFKLDLPQDNSIEVVYIAPDMTTENGLSLRDMSVILRFKVGESSVLFTGNMGRYLGEQLTGRQDIQSEFLKMPYPGSEETVPTSFYDTVDPSFVLIPSPKRDWCTDNGRLAREWTIKKEVPTWFTGANGNIHVIWRNNETVISPQHGDPQCKLKEFGNLVVKK